MRRLCLLLVIAPLLGGCSDARPLLDERTTEPYASWARVRGAGHQRQVEIVEAQGPGEAGLRVRLHAWTRAQPVDDRLIVLQPGVLADHRTWRFLAPLLVERNDLLLVDPPGTAGSDAPDPRRHPAPAYTPAWIGRSTLRAVGRWQRARGDTRRLLLVGHSLGSSAFVRALTDPARPTDIAAIARRVDGLVLLAMPDVLMDEVPESLRTVAELTDVEVRAATALGILEREMAEAVHGAVVNPAHRGLRQEAERLAGMIGSDRTRRPAQAMLRRFVPLGPEERPLPEAVQAIAERQRTLTLPVLLIWGVRDDTLPHGLAAQVAARLPDVQRLDVPDAKHSVHQERADIVAWAVARFLARHPGTRPR